MFKQFYFELMDGKHIFYNIDIKQQDNHLSEEKIPLPKVQPPREAGTSAPREARTPREARG